MNINKFYPVHLKTVAINTSVFVLLTFTEIILFLNKVPLLTMTAVI